MQRDTFLKMMAMASVTPAADWTGRMSWVTARILLVDLERSDLHVNQRGLDVGVSHQ